MVAKLSGNGTETAQAGPRREPELAPAEEKGLVLRAAYALSSGSVLRWGIWQSTISRQCLPRN